jgi:hypothetical protein
MKKTLFTISVALTFAAGYAQTAADQEAIKTLLVQETKNAYAVNEQEYNKNWIKAPHTYRAWNSRTGYDVKQGWEAIEKERLAAFKTSKPREVNPITENFVFKFYGSDACFVTYDQYMYGKENKPSKEVRMMEKENGAWKIAALVALWDYSQTKFEEDLVRKTIETETKSYHAADTKTMLAQWSDKPYNEHQTAVLTSMIGTPYATGKSFEQLKTFLQSNLKPSNTTSAISDYNVHIAGSTAWATFTQVDTQDGKITAQTRQVRILERIGGAWKIVFVGLQEIPGK